MDVLVCYDIQTDSREGKRRLKQIAKICLQYGDRVQYSVFECRLTPVSYVALLSKLQVAMNLRGDSIRIYKLSGDRSNYLTSLGVDRSYDPDDLLMFETIKKITVRVTDFMRKKGSKLKK